MPVYIVTGKLGSGKTLGTVARLQEYVCAGKQVASNIDVNLRELCGNEPSKKPIRLPDRPTVEDLIALGPCHSTSREELNGGIFLDECGTWLNSREWSGPGRAKLIDWLLHSRKYGWDVYFIIQSLSLMDKQIRDALAEYVVVCKRLDRLKIPVVGTLIRMLTFGRKRGMMPKLHVCTVYYGVGPTAMVAEAWRFSGKDLYAAYSSAQIITDDHAGTYSLIWYRTDEEIAVEKAAEAIRVARLPKPKLAAVARIMQLDAQHRVEAMRRLQMGHSPSRLFVDRGLSAQAQRVVARSAATSRLTWSEWMRFLLAAPFLDLSTIRAKIAAS